MLVWTQRHGDVIMVLDDVDQDILYNALRLLYWPDYYKDYTEEELEEIRKRARRFASYLDVESTDYYTEDWEE